MTPEGTVKVSDLGLAGFLHEAANDPRSGKIVGTADYLSPEKILTPTQLTPLSDIYSLGCTLYYAVTGKVPFPGGSTRDKARRHCEETPWHPRQFNPDIDDDFVDLIADMMEKDPDSRIQSAAEVADRLKPWCESTVPIVAGVPTTPSRWTRPGIERDEKDDTVDDFGDVGVPKNDEEAVDSQVSQGTFPLGSSSEETAGSRHLPTPIPPPTEVESHQQLIKKQRRTLTLAILISFAVGVVLTWFALTYAS